MRGTIATSIAVAADLGVVLSNLDEHGRAAGVLQEIVGGMAEITETLYALIVSLAALDDLTTAEPIVHKLETDYPTSPLGRRARQLVGGK